MKKIINKVCENDCLTVRFIDKFKGRFGIDLKYEGIETI